MLNESQSFIPQGEGILGLEFGAIDYRRPFLPEEFTHLTYTAVYHELDAAVRLRYNQLFALYVNELTIFFETRVAPYYLKLIESRLFSAKEKENIRRFVGEEATHAEMFRRLNRAAAPEFYRNSDFYFLRVPELPMAKLVPSLAGFLAPAIVLLGTIQEERVASYGARYTSAIEPNFFAAAAAHCGEECEHVDFGAQLLAPLWFRTGRIQRQLNRRIFFYLLREFFLAPKRGGMNILDQLVREYPAVQQSAPRLRKELSELGNNPAFLGFLYSRECLPNAMRFFDSCIELQGVSAILPGYIPGGA